jgi:hypothetical protein
MWNSDKSRWHKNVFSRPQRKRLEVWNHFQKILNEIFFRPNPPLSVEITDLSFSFSRRP